MGAEVRWDRGAYVWVEHIHDHDPDNCPAHLPACPIHGEEQTS